MDRAFSRADLDGDGFIDYSEWQISCVNKDQILKKDRLAAAFKHFVLGSGNKKFGNDQIWKQIIREADEDGDG